MKLEPVKTVPGIFDFDVTEAGTIRRVKISKNIKEGDIFNIYYGDGDIKGGGIWLADGITENLEADVIRSIEGSEVYIAVSFDSEVFYKDVCAQYCDCNCEEPRVNHDDNQVIAADLNYPDYGRSHSRFVVYINKCKKCKETVTVGEGFGCYSTNGESELKQAAERAAGEPIDWDRIITVTPQPKSKDNWPVLEAII